MKNVRYLPDESLRFHYRDACEAIAAYPESDNVIRYVVDRDACRYELERRESLRHWRKKLTITHDRLTVPIRQRRRAVTTAYDLATRHGASVYVGVLRLMERERGK